MNEITAPRSIEQVTAEISGIMEQTRRYVLYQVIEVGRRLAEARTMLPHGQWGTWLKESVRFSQSTAGNMIRIFEEYGAAQMCLFGVEANSQTLGNLSYTKALALLALPGEEREEFAVAVGAESLSTRKLEAEVARWKAERDELAGDVERLEGICIDKEKNLGAVKKDLAKTSMAAKKVERELAAAKETLNEMEARIKALNELAEEPPEPDEHLAEMLRDSDRDRLAALDRVAKLEKQLAAASNQAVNAFRLHFDAAQRSVNEMTVCLAKLDDDEMRGKLASALRALCEATLEAIRGGKDGRNETD